MTTHIIPLTIPQRQPAAPLVPEPDSSTVVRAATAEDAPAIHDLITQNLQTGHLLPRTLADVTARASRFTVVADVAGILACGELAPLNASVAEVRSLVVRDGARGMGLGHTVVNELRRRARIGRYRNLCAFTHDPRFFVRMGFSIVPHTWLPEKVAADCWSCQHFQKCGQYAVVDSRAGLQPAGRPETLS
ncbi:MAG: GNAT family N-acetyltransferase [Acidobacteria bacterium]|nr:GNAT family N-acetyltransferase [Acidobacteriota bacterium]